MKLSFATFFVCVFSLSIFAQDSPKSAVKEKAAPVTAIIPATTVRQITDLQKDMQIANLQAGNLQLQIEKANAELVKLRETAKKTEESLNQALLAAAQAAGIASDKLVEYDITNAPDGAWILKKKEKPVAPAGK